MTAMLRSPTRVSNSVAGVGVKPDDEPTWSSMCERSIGILAPASVSPSQDARTVPRREDRTGAEGAGGGSSSVAIRTVWTSENSPAPARVATAQTLNCHVVPEAYGLSVV